MPEMTLVTVSVMLQEMVPVRVPQVQAMMPPSLEGSDRAVPVDSDTPFSTKVPAVERYLLARVVGAHAPEVVLPVGVLLPEEVISPPGRPSAWVSNPPPPHPSPPLVSPRAYRTTAFPPSSVTW